MDTITVSLESISITLTQGIASYVMQNTDTLNKPGTLANFTAPIAAGMIHIISNWGDSTSKISWFDQHNYFAPFDFKNRAVS